MNRGFKNMQNFEEHPDLRELLKEDDEMGLFGPGNGEKKEPLKH